MTTEQRAGFRLPWSSDRHTAAPAGTPAVEAAPDDEDAPSPVEEASPAAEVAEAAADELDATGAGAPSAVVDSGDDGAAGSWVLGSWSGREVDGLDDASADSSDQKAAGEPTDDTSSDGSPASRLTWPAEDIARATGHATASHATASRTRPHTAAATDAQMADGTPAEMPEHDAAPEVTAMSPSSAPAPSAPASAASAAASVSATAAAPAGATAGSKPTKFMAELSRAMQTAAQASREESLTRLAAEAKGRIEEIQQLGSSGTTELRRKADDDVAATREWSKAEIARIREETEHRIAERKGRLEADVEHHVAMVRRRADLVREAVTRHETELAAFIEQLMAEEDPSRIATLAQHMPEPPVLVEIDADDAATSDDEPAQEMATTTAAGPGSAAGEAGPESGTAHLSAETAAAAEAEALAGLDAGQAGDDAWFSGTSGDARNGTGDDAAGRTELIVTGLASVAGIAGFKRELSRLAGVHSVGVSAGQAGEFVFAVSHDAGLELDESIPSMTAFEAQVAGRRTGSLMVTATEPAAGE